MGWCHCRRDPVENDNNKGPLTCASSACCFIFMSQRDIKSSDNPFVSTMHCHISVSLPSRLATTSIRCKVFPSTYFLVTFFKWEPIKGCPSVTTTKNSSCKNHSQRPFLCGQLLESELKINKLKLRAWRHVHPSGLETVFRGVARWVVPRMPVYM